MLMLNLISETKRLNKLVDSYLIRKRLPN